MWRNVTSFCAQQMAELEFSKTQRELLDWLWITEFYYANETLSSWVVNSEL